MQDWAPPSEFDGYRILDTLGSGAMGRVYLAQERALDRMVAIKVLAPATPNPRAHACFLNEARAIARLQHPNVVAIYRIGTILDRPYLAYEYVAGRNLAQLDTPLSWEEALSIALALARGLSAVHSAGVLHRDIKPANVVLTQSGVAKLIDFGLAKLENEPSPSPSVLGAAPPEDACRRAPLEVSMAGAIIGTPRYMPPERWEGQPATTRSDVYSLGLVVYQLCTGQRPYEGLSTRDMVSVARSRGAPSVTSLRSDLPQPFADIIDRCVSRDPAARFAGGGELLAALEEFESFCRTFRFARANAQPLSEDAYGALSRSFARLLPYSDQLVARVYERLFEEAPALRTLFRANMHEQRMKLASTLRLIIEQLHRPEQVNPLLDELGQRHASYGVRATHFEVFGRVLLATLAELEGANWTNDLEATWTRAIQHITSVMLRGMRAPRAPLTGVGMPAGAGATPAVRYARSGDALLAYQVFGSGRVDLVVVREWASHLETAWRWPAYARYLWALGGLGRVIVFDPCGAGLSERGLPLRSIDERLEDVRAVMDAAGCARAIVLGTSVGSITAQLFAASFPERTRALVSIAGTPRLVFAPDATFGWSDAVIRATLEQIRVGWGGPLLAEKAAPSMASDKAFRAWWASYLRTSTSPVTAAGQLRMDAAIDTRRALGAIGVPSLVLHRRDDRLLPAAGSRAMAERIPEARYVELPGADHLPFLGEQGPLLDALCSFVDTLQGPRDSGTPRSADATQGCGYGSVNPARRSYVTRDDMDALDPGIWPALPERLREGLPAEERAPSRSAIVLRRALHLAPDFADQLCKRLRLVEGEDWPLWRFVAALHLVEREVGPATVLNAGRHLASALSVLATRDTIEDAFDDLDQAFREAHHHAGAHLAGGFRVVDRTAGRIYVDAATLYPCEVERGLIAGLCERFTGVRAEYGVLSTTQPKREGDAVTHYVITYDLHARAIDRATRNPEPPSR